MGNKNTSPHLTKTLSLNEHDNHRFIQQHDDPDNSFETSSYQSNNGKKYGPSPRFRRRHSKGKKAQVISRINYSIYIYLHNLLTLHFPFRVRVLDLS
jgi:hypothetical protein